MRPDALLTFSGAVEHDAAIEPWFERHGSDLAAIARDAWQRMRGCGPDVRELLHDGCPTACVQEAPFGYVNAFRAHVNVGFFHGHALPDPAGRLIGHGKYMRHLKLRPGAPFDAVALDALIEAAYRDIVARVAAAAR